jgi:hypothetical protein
MLLFAMPLLLAMLLVATLSPSCDGPRRPCVAPRLSNTAIGLVKRLDLPLRAVGASEATVPNPALYLQLAIAS